MDYRAGEHMNALRLRIIARALGKSLSVLYKRREDSTFQEVTITTNLMIAKFMNVIADYNNLFSYDKFRNAVTKYMKEE